MKKKFLRLFVLLFCMFFGLPFILIGCGQAKDELNFYKIEAIFDDSNMTLNCTQEVKYVNNTEDLLEEICFSVYANAFNEGKRVVSTAYLDKAYPNGQSFGGIEFENITISDKTADFALNQTKEILTVALDEGIFPDESVTIKMEYVIYLANINHRLGYGENTVNVGNFFPIACVYENGFVKNTFCSNGDPFYSDVSNFEVVIQCPKDYVVATSGDKGELIESSTKTVSCTAKKVRDFCFVLSKEFDVLTQECNGVAVNYYYYDDELSEKHLQTSVKALETFEKMFGAYEYNQLSVVEANFCFGGMEYPNLVMVNGGITDDETYNYVIVHEIAHQWWYGMVGNNQFSEPWIDEGLTEFSTALFFENNSEYGFDYEQIMLNATATYKNFVDVFTKINGQIDETMTRNLSEYATEPEYVNCTYTKGMLMFDAVRKSMSDRRFFKCLQTYFETYKYKNSSTEKLIGSFSKSSHTNLISFFNAWLYGEVVVN